MNKSILILGGDERNIRLANIFASKERNVCACCFDDMSVFSNKVKVFESLNEAMENADVVISGVPASLDDMTLHTPMYSEKVYFYNLFDMMRNSKLFLGGRISERLFRMANVYDISAIDYFNREELMILNTIPTVEGAIEKLMSESDFTIHLSNCLVMGFGRIGKLLSRRLNDLGANVWVEARKAEDLAWIDALGYKKVELKNIARNIDRYDVIFNTIPHEILSCEDYEDIKKDCILIDLASLPGGLNSIEAEKYRLKFIRALGLPGKCAPETAARYLCRTIDNILKETEG